MTSAPMTSPLSRIRRMSAGEASRRTSWARAVPMRGEVELPYGLRARPRGTPGLFAPGAFDRFHGPGATAFVAVDAVEPSITAMAVLSARTVRAALARALKGAERDPAAAPLSELEAGAAHFAASRILEALAGTALRLGVVLTERRSIREALGHEVWEHLGLELEIGGELHPVDLFRRGALPAGSGARASTHLRQIPLALSLSAGFSSLSLAELASLREGDALLLAQPADPGEAFLFVPGADYARRAKVERRTISLGPPTDLPSHHPPEPMDSEATTRLLSNARVDVSAELARISLRVAEIERLSEGEVFALGVDVGTEVVLRAGDAIVARGELVDVDGRLAVLIRSLGG